MAKKVIIDIEVNSQSIDQAVVKTGELKKLSDKISIQYDIDGKPLDIVISKSLNLQQQVKALTAELRKTKEGTAEFQLLSKQLGDTKDALAVTTAKSKDLFSSLSLLPGPVGDLFRQLSMVVDLLKTFSTFSLKDLKFQFKETINDLNDIRQGFGNVKDGTDAATQSTEASASAYNNLTNASANALTATKDLGTELKSQGKLNREFAMELGRYEAATNTTITTNQKYKNGLKETTYTVVQANGATETLTKTEMAAAIATRNQATATTQLAAAEGTATVATYTLEGAFISLAAATGIGLLLVAIGKLVELLIEGGKWLYKLATRTLDAEEATKKLTKALDDLDTATEKSNNSLKRAGNERVALLKSQGASEEQIRKQSIKNIYAEREATSKALGETMDIIKKLNANRGKNDEENNKQIERALKKKIELEERYKDQSSSIRVAELDNITANNKDREQKAKELAAKIEALNKAHRDKIKQDNKTADEALFQLEQENASLRIKGIREREDQELANAKKAEEKKIDELEITETRKQEILAQITTKYTEKAKDIKKKRDDEDIKEAQDFVYKLADISIAAEKEGTDRDIAAREEKYKRDLTELEKDKLFIKMSEESKAFYRSELVRAKEADIAKIRLDAKIKEYQDELMLLEAQQKSLTAGTDAYLANALAIENTAYQIKLANAKDNAKQIEAVNKEHAANLKAIDLASFEAKKQIEIQRYQVVATIGQSLQQLAGKQKGIAIAGVVIEKAAAIGQIWANNAIANAKATAASPLTFGQPWVTVNTVSAVLSTAATVAAAAKAISEINNPSGGGGESAAAAAQPATPNYGRNYETGGMIGGKRHYEGGTLIEAEKGEAIMSRGAVTMFQPMLSMMNQMGGGTGFAPSLVSTSYDNPKVSTPSQDDKPLIIKSYVVSNELTSEAQKQARLKDLSTI